MLCKEILSSAMNLAEEPKRETIDMIKGWQQEFLSARDIDGILEESELEEALNDLCLLHYNLECALENLTTDEEKIIWDQHLERLRLFMQEVLGVDADILQILFEYKKNYFGQENLFLLQDLQILEEHLEESYKRADQEISEDAAAVLKDAQAVHEQNSEAIEAVYQTVDALNTRLEHVEERIDRDLIGALRAASAGLKQVGSEAIAASEALKDTLKKV